MVIRRPVSYGYRVGEVELPIPDDAKEEAEIIVDEDETPRRVVAVSLGPHIIGAARPKVDRDDPYTKVAGAMKRVMKQPPRRQRKLLVRLDRFVRKWLRHNMTPLSSNTDVSFETWINNCPYPLRDKERLKKVHEENLEPFSDKYVSEVKGFAKDESYDVYKHLRWIMSRTDEFKCMYGPWIKVIEKEVYKHPSFIKNIPTNERGQYITELLGTDGPFFETDYTAYESHFDLMMMNVLEFNLYEYMTQKIPGASEFMRMNYGVLGDDNKIVSKNMKFKVQARMSGEMSTSLGNGFSNLMTMLFVAHQNGCSNVEGVVEGDDGLFVLRGAPPETADFANVGFHIKLEEHTHINECSFCGLIFDEIDQKVVTDPRKVMLTFPWTTRQYLMSSSTTHLALLRCKSLSLLAQYPGSPIIQAVAKYGLRISRGISDRVVRHTLAKSTMSVWEREKLYNNLRAHMQPQPVGQRTRNLIAERYGITVEQQLRVEKLYDSKNDLCPISLDFPHFWNEDQGHYYDNYFVDFPHHEGCLTLGYHDSDTIEKLLSNTCSVKVI
jgi:hypothetical protein